MRTLHICLSIFVLSGIGIRPSNAEEINTRALNEVSQEFAICRGYFTLIALCLDPAKDANVAQRYRSSADQFATVTFQFGKAAGLSDAALLARATLAFKQVQTETDKDCRNIAVVLEKYSDRCSGMAKDVEGTIRGIMQRVK